MLTSGTFLAPFPGRVPTPQPGLGPFLHIHSFFAVYTEPLGSAVWGLPRRASYSEGCKAHLFPAPSEKLASSSGCGAALAVHLLDSGSILAQGGPSTLGSSCDDNASGSSPTAFLSPKCTSLALEPVVAAILTGRDPRGEQGPRGRQIWLTALPQHYPPLSVLFIMPVISVWDHLG